LTAQPAGDQGRRRGRGDPVRRRLRGRDRGRRRHPDHRHAHLAVRAVRPPPITRVTRAGAHAMKITGSNILDYPVEMVWAALPPPRVLVATIPGCESLTTTGENSYDMRVTAGVAAIKGTYQGSCALSDLKQHESLVMKLTGAGAPGTIDATVQVF